MGKKKKGPSAWAKKMDQRYVSKAELSNEAKTALKALVKANIVLEQGIDRAFGDAVAAKLGPKFVTRLRNTAKRRQMSPRQYANSILCKPKGKK